MKSHYSSYRSGPIPRSGRFHRSGSVLLEAAVAIGLSTLLLSLMVQMLTLTATERRFVERRAIAQQQVANLVEQVSLLGYDELTLEALQTISLSDEVSQLLPRAETTWNVHDENDGVAAKRISVTISWIGAGNQRERPVRLTQWRFAPPADTSQPADAVAPEPEPADATPAVMPPAEVNNFSGASEDDREASEPAVPPPASRLDLEVPVHSGGTS